MLPWSLFMTPSEFEPQWESLFTEIQTEMRTWRRAHPKATMREIELATEQVLARLAARMVADVAAASDTAHFRDQPREARPCCPDCQVPLQARGRKERHLRTHGAQQVALTRDHGACPRCGQAFFPLG
jgi:hypothetical protein